MCQSPPAPNETQTCQLLERLFRSADEGWAEPVLRQGKLTITPQKNPVKARVNLPVDYYCAKFEVTWDDTALNGLSVTLMYVNESGEEKPLTPGNRLFVLSHEKGSTREVWHIKLHRRKEWRISLLGSELLGQSALVNIRVCGGTWDWESSPQAKKAKAEFDSALNELFCAGQYTRWIWKIINDDDDLGDRGYEEKEACFWEVIIKLQECNLRRLRMWNRGKWENQQNKFSTYLSPIVKNTCIDFRRGLGGEPEEPVEGDEEPESREADEGPESRRARTIEHFEAVVMEADEIEAVAAEERSPLIGLLDHELMKEIEGRLWEFLRK